jgi:hypothetical protein
VIESAAGRSTGQRPAGFEISSELKGTGIEGRPREVRLFGDHIIDGAPRALRQTSAQFSKYRFVAVQGRLSSSNANCSHASAVRNKHDRAA